MPQARTGTEVIYRVQLKGRRRWGSIASLDQATAHRWERRQTPILQTWSSEGPYPNNPSLKCSAHKKLNTKKVDSKSLKEEKYRRSIQGGGLFTSGGPDEVEASVALSWEW